VGEPRGAVLLEVRGLKTHFFLDEGTVHAVDGVDLVVHRGRTLCIVGESGCGKSVTAHSILKLVEPPGRILEGRILLHRPDGVVDLAALDPKGAEICSIRGNDIAMIFQEPMTSLSPVHTIGHQMIETLLLHKAMTQEQARQHSIRLLGRVGIPRPEQRIDCYTFQLSGGMRQRAMIAIALACSPSLLIADEPTTALDVTTQAQILDLMLELQAELGMSIMFITHDLGVVAEIADEVAVMYLGEVVEIGPVDAVFHDPRHPYTRALLRSIPTLENEQDLESIRGMVPDPYNRPRGCLFHPRCDSFMAGRCDAVAPPYVGVGDGRSARCLLYEDSGVPAATGEKTHGG
jgi:peptide/nickel transport system ATP-binding protein